MIIAFVDIETAGEYRTFAELPADGQEAFKRKVTRFLNPTESLQTSIEDIYDQQVALHPEFSKIVALSVGMYYIDKASNEERILVRVFTGDEKTILEKFIQSIEKSNPNTLCAHNGKGFDYPFMCKRIIKHGIRIPSILNVSGKKPWEINLLDTMELWRFTDLKNYTSLIVMAYFFGIPSPKQDIDGSKVHAAFYAGEIGKIAKYNAGDVVTDIHVYRKLVLLPDIKEPAQIIYDPILPI